MFRRLVHLVLRGDANVKVGTNASVPREFVESLIPREQKQYNRLVRIVRAAPFLLPVVVQHLDDESIQKRRDVIDGQYDENPPGILVVAHPSVPDHVIEEVIFEFLSGVAKSYVDDKLTQRKEPECPYDRRWQMDDTLTIPVTKLFATPLFTRMRRDRFQQLISDSERLFTDGIGLRTRIGVVSEKHHAACQEFLQR